MSGCLCHTWQVRYVAWDSNSKMLARGVDEPGNGWIWTYRLIGRQVGLSVGKRRLLRVLGSFRSRARARALRD